MNVTLERVDEPLREGSDVVLTMSDPLGRRVRWVARITVQRPPHDVVFGREARWVDEQVEGPFRRWSHSHEFEQVDQKTTRVLDRVTYQMPFGPFGWIADVAFLRRQIRGGFQYRHAMLTREFEQA